MPRNRRNNRRRNRNSGDGEASASGTQVATPKASSKRPKRSSSRRGGQQSNQTQLLIIGGGALVLVLVAVVAWQILSGAGAASAFDFDVYQGEEVLGGDKVKFSDLLDDGKPIVLNFWAGNCPPCRAEMPALQRVWEAHEDEIIFVGLDVGVFTGLGTRDSALALLNELNVTYPAGAPPSRTPMVNYSVRSMPTTVFFGADGQVFQRWDGAITERQMNEIVNEMLEQASQALSYIHNAV